MAVLQISGVWLNKSPAPIFSRQQPRSRASSSTVFAAATAASPPQSPSTIQARFYHKLCVYIYMSLCIIIDFGKEFRGISENDKLTRPSNNILVFENCDSL